MSSTHILRRTLRAVIMILLVGGLWSSTVSSEAWAQNQVSSRAETLAILESIASSPGGFSLRAWVNDGSQSDIPIGHQVEYHFLADRSSHLTVLHVDSHGVATLLFPNRIDSGNWLRAGIELTFPSVDAGFSLQAEPPVGREYVLALATAVPIGAEDLGLSLAGDPVAVVEAERAPALAARLSERFMALDASARAAVHFQQLIVGRSEAAEYESVDIVSYFTTRTRSIRQPKLDLHVHFASGSEELDDRARRNLDEVAAALKDPRMREMRFSVGGHTDDVGEERYNDVLSLRRAQSAVRYLTERHEIDADRLEATHYGERRPLEPNSTPEARQLNRRVEFELLR